MDSMDDDGLLLAGEATVARARLLLESMNTKVAPVVDFVDLGVGDRDGERRQERMEDEAVFGRDGELIDSRVRAGYQVTGEYGEREVAPSVHVLRMEEKFVDPSPVDDVDVSMAMFLCPVGEDDTRLGSLETVESYVSYFEDRLDKSSFEEEGVRQTFDGKRLLEKGNVKHSQEECDTWKLVLNLHTSKIEKFDAPEGTLIPPQMAIESGWSADPRLQLWTTVTRWLQSVKPLAGDMVDTRSGAYLPYTVRNGCAGKSVDPDAQLRDGIFIHPDDEDDVKAMLGKVYELVRCGAFYHEWDSETERELSNAAVHVCNAFGQTWRAASLSGGRPYRINESNKWVGNANRAVWKYACLKLAGNAFARGNEEQGAARQSALIEGSIYAALAGDLEMLLGSPLCRSWRDRCWAFFRCMSLAKIDIICSLHRKAMSNSFSHMPGPSNPKYEEGLWQRAEKLSQYDEFDVFSRVRGDVPGTEVYFFQVQRSLIEGNFSSLLCVGGEQQRPQDGDRVFVSDMSVCEFLCGRNWMTLGDQTIAEVCGDRYLVDAGRSLPSTASQEAPCWRLENGAFVTQLLRFMAHAVIYMRNMSSQGSVVYESNEIDPLVTEALVLAYIRYLLQDPTFILERYAVLPVFYSSLCSSGNVNLPLVVQAAMFEAAVVADPISKEKLFEKWKTGVEPSHLLPRAARQALRNVRRQWLCHEKPCALVDKALREIKLSVDTTTAFKDAEEDDEQFDIRAIETWQWLLCDPMTENEALLQANGIIRDLVHESFTTSSSRHPSALDIAKQFLRQRVLEYVDSQPSSQEVQYKMSSTPRAIVDQERACWVHFFNAIDKVDSWRQSIAWLREQDMSTEEAIARLPRQLSREIYEKAVVVSQSIYDTLCIDGGFLVDDPHAEQDVGDKFMCDAVFDEDPVTVDEERRRTEQLGDGITSPGSLRKRCVPHLINLYVHVLDEAAEWLQIVNGENTTDPANLYKLAINISNVVADDRRGLRFCFETTELKAFLETIRKLALQLLHIQKTLSF